MKNIISTPLFKRKAICGILGIGFGFLFAYVISTMSPAIQAMADYWGSALMWSFVVNRLLIGMFILTAGAFTVIPLFNWRYHPALRGTTIGALVSLDIAFTAIIGNTDNVMMIFWMTILTGAFYGLIIDLVATKFAGEGKDLLDY